MSDLLRRDLPGLTRAKRRPLRRRAPGAGAPGRARPQARGRLRIVGHRAPRQLPRGRLPRGRRPAARLAPLGGRRADARQPPRAAVPPRPHEPRPGAGAREGGQAHRGRGVGVALVGLALPVRLRGRRAGRAQRHAAGGLPGGLAPGRPIDAFRVTRSAFEHRFRFHRTSEGPRSVVVVISDEAMLEERAAVERIYGARAEELAIEVSVVEAPTREALADVLASPADFLHYIGHCDPGGCGAPTAPSRSPPSTGPTSRPSS